MSSDSTDVALKEWKYNTYTAIVIGGLSVLAFYLGALFGGDNALILSIVPMAIISFFGMMAIASRYEITSKKESKGMMRRALTATLILVFVAVIAISFSGKLQVDTDNKVIVEKLTEHFAYIIITIIGFYFGTKSVRDYMKIRYGNKDEEKKEDPIKGIQELDKKNLDRAIEGGTKVNDSDWSIIKQKKGFKIGKDKEKEQNKHAQSWTSLTQEKEFDKEPTDKEKTDFVKSLSKSKKPVKECTDGEWIEKEFWQQWSQFKHKSKEKWKVRGYSNVQWECKRKPPNA